MNDGISEKTMLAHAADQGRLGEKVPCFFCGTTKLNTFLRRYSIKDGHIQVYSCTPCDKKQRVARWEAR